MHSVAASESSKILQRPVCIQIYKRKQEHTMKRPDNWQPRSRSPDTPTFEIIYHQCVHVY